MQCALAYHNSNTPLCLNVSLSCWLHLESSLWGLLSFLIDISCISHVMTYSNVNSFMGCSLMLSLSIHMKGENVQIMSSHNIFIFNSNLQAKKLIICKCFHLVYVIKHVICLLHLACEEFAPKKKGWIDSWIHKCCKMCFIPPSIFYKIKCDKVVSNKLITMMDIFFKTLFLYAFFMIASTHDDGASFNNLPQILNSIKIISILNFHK